MLCCGCLLLWVNCCDRCCVVMCVLPCADCCAFFGRWCLVLCFGAVSCAE